MRQIPQIQKFMTQVPISIRKATPAKVAARMLREYKVRHLPVIDYGKLVGLVSDKEIISACRSARADALCMQDIMSHDLHIVSPEALLRDVVKDMLRLSRDYAIVQQTNGKVIGIFTTIDALRVLGEMLISGNRGIPSL